MRAAFMMVLAAFVVFALRFWHVGFHFLHLLCHLDDFGFLSFLEVVPVGDSFNDLVHAPHHLRAHTRHLAVMVALMMLLALLFLVFAALFLFTILFVFLFVAA